MTPLKDQVREFVAFDEDKTRDQAKHEDSDGYFGFILGAEWQHSRLAPLLELLPEIVEALESSKSAFSCIRHNCKIDSLILALDVSSQITMQHIDFSEATVTETLAKIKEAVSKT